MLDSFGFRTLAFLVAGAAALLPVGRAAHADVIFSNLTAGNTYNTTLGGSDATNVIGSTNKLAERFNSAGNYSVTGIDIGLVFQSGTNTDTVSLWTDVAGLPGTQLGSWTASGFPSAGGLSTPTASMAGGQVISVSGVTLSAGKSYFLVADLPPLGTNLTWFDETNAVSANAYANANGGGWAASGSPDGAYAVFGSAVTVAAPEPATLALLGFALTGLAAVRRRRA